MLGFACGLAFGSVASCSAAAAPWQDSDCKTSSCGNSSCKMLQIGGERSEIFKALAVLHGIRISRLLTQKLSQKLQAVVSRISIDKAWKN